MDPVAILSSKGITKKNKHELSTLADLLATYTFKDKRQKLAIKRKTASEIQAVAALLQEVARLPHPTCKECQTPVRVCSGRGAKRRKTFFYESPRRFSSGDFYLNSDLEEEPYPLRVHNDSPSDYKPRRSFEKLEYTSATHYESDVRKSKSFTSLEAGIPVIFRQYYTQRSENKETTPDPIYAHLPEVKTQGLHWLLDSNYPNKACVMAIILGHDETCDGKTAVISSVLDAGGSTLSHPISPSALVRIIPEDISMLIPIQYLYPCPPKNPGERVVILRGPYATRAEWTVTSIENEIDVLLEAQHSMIIPISNVTRCV